jgi:hypothetical protein
VLGTITVILAVEVYLNLLADDGRNLEAVEMATLLDKSPFVRTSSHTFTVLGNRPDALRLALAPDQLLAAEARGRARDLAGTAAEILAELEKAVDA